MYPVRRLQGCLPRKDRYSRADHGDQEEIGKGTGAAADPESNLLRGKQPQAVSRHAARRFHSR